MSFNEADRDQYGGDCVAQATAGPKGPAPHTAYAWRSSMDFSAPGDIVYIPEPSRQLHFGALEINTANNESLSIWANALQDGWEICTAKDFSPRLKDLWKPNTKKQLSFGGRDDNTLVIVYMPKERYDAIVARDRYQSDQIQQTWEDKQASISESAARVGLEVGIDVQIEDEVEVR